MKAASDPAYQYLLAKIDDCIETARSAGLEDTVELIKVVRMDLLIRVNRIGETELDAFLAALEDRRRQALSSEPLPLPREPQPRHAERDG